MCNRQQVNLLMCNWQQVWHFRDLRSVVVLQSWLLSYLICLLSCCLFSRQSNSHFEWSDVWSTEWLDDGQYIRVVLSRNSMADSVLVLISCTSKVAVICNLAAEVHWSEFHKTSGTIIKTVVDGCVYLAPSLASLTLGPFEWLRKAFDLTMTLLRSFIVYAAMSETVFVTYSFVAFM